MLLRRLNVKAKRQLCPTKTADDFKVMIWDLHCHLSGVSGRTPDERMAQLIEFADRMGIERICIYMGMRWSSNPSPEDSFWIPRAAFLF